MRRVEKVLPTLSAAQGLAEINRDVKFASDGSCPFKGSWVSTAVSVEAFSGDAPLPRGSVFVAHCGLWEEVAERSDSPESAALDRTR